LAVKEECKSNTNCEFCDNVLSANNVPKCNQCLDKFFLLDGRCYSTCPENTLSDYINFTCFKQPTCNQPNCSTCNLESKCKDCKRGFFLYNNQCLEKCPSGYRADRITWTCLEPPVFAWYWVYPSRTSCRNFCGVVYEDWDCSCRDDCFLYGNCCQDIEYHCTQILFWRKSSFRKNENNVKSLPKPLPVSQPLQVSLPVPEPITK